MLYLGIVFAGGMGALLRYLLGRLTMSLQWTSLPLGTLLANLIGCFLIGYLSWVLVYRWNVSQNLQIIILTGFLGGFTTFSAFSLEVLSMFQQEATGRAFAYISINIVLCILMTFLGLLIARQT